MLHKGNNHSLMYLWHNYQRTLWFEGLHSEKPTNFYNLMSWNTSGQGLPMLYSPARVHVKKKRKQNYDTFVILFMALGPPAILNTVTATLTPVTRAASLFTNGTGAIYFCVCVFCQSAHHGRQINLCR